MCNQVKIIKQSEFPDKLKNIKKAPKVLYAMGNINLLYQYSFGIVGSRNPTEYGIRVCREFSKEFALRDIPIVSGMANGIDQIAHETVLEYHSKTIGVLGCGIEYYLKSQENNRLISEFIKREGLILSEYDFSVEKSKENFPQRNRIIAAISEGILVVEAAFRSGSSITARWAKEYKKEVFAVPGKIYDKMSVGTNNLIKKGAICVTNTDEIFKIYPQFKKKKRKTFSKATKIRNEKNYKKEWKEIINFLKKDMLSIDELQLKTQKDLRILMHILLEMEIAGIIEQELGIGYKLKKVGDI